tara:strand:- start:789 stop:935 length:147 start_codon:yes stop_codon:yes gene_type:complete
MKNNKKFITLLKSLIKEAIKGREVLLESPVPTQSEILVENKINKILNK